MAVCFNKVITHVEETFVTGIDFEANALMKLYEQMLLEHNVKHIPKIDRFTQDIIKALPQLERRGGINQKVELYLKTDIDILARDVMSTSLFLEQLNKQYRLFNSSRSFGKGGLLQQK